MSGDSDYYWQVHSSDGVTNTPGPIWRFKTKETIDPADTFASSFEEGPESWTTTPATGLWRWITPDNSSYANAFQSRGSFWFGREDTGDYAVSGPFPASGVLVSPVINLTGLSSPSLLFSSWYDTEDQGVLLDTKKVYLSDKNQLVQVLVQYASGPADYRQWAWRYADLTAAKAAIGGTEFRLRFEFQASTSNNNYRGWYVDHVRVFNDADHDWLSLPEEVKRGSDASLQDTDGDGFKDFVDARPKVEDNAPTYPLNDPIGNVTFDLTEGFVDVNLLPPQDASGIEGVDFAMYFQGQATAPVDDASVRFHLERRGDNHYVGRFPIPRNFADANVTHERIIIVLKDVHGNEETFANETMNVTFQFRKTWTQVSEPGYHELWKSVINEPPSTPQYLQPYNGETSVNPGTIRLRWENSTDSEGHRVTYQTYAGTQNPPQSLVCQSYLNYCDFTAGNDERIFWKVVATDGNASNPGRTWYFDTTPSSPCPPQGCNGGGPPPPTPQQDSVDPTPLEHRIHRFVLRAAQPPHAPSAIDGVLAVAWDTTEPLLARELLLEDAGVQSELPGQLLNWVVAGLRSGWQFVVDEEAPAFAPSFIWGADAANGKIAGDIAAGLLIYGDVRDVFLGAYQGDDTKVMLGFVGLGLTVAPALDGPYSAAKASIKSVWKPLGKLMAHELDALVKEAVHNPGLVAKFADRTGRLVYVATWVGTDVLRGQRFADLAARYSAFGAACPLGPGCKLPLSEIRNFNEFQAADTALLKYGFKQIDKLVAEGSRISAARDYYVLADGERVAGGRVLEAAAFFAKRPGVDKTVRNLESHLDLNLESAKGYARELTKGFEWETTGKRLGNGNWAQATVEEFEKEVDVIVDGVTRVWQIDNYLDVPAFGKLGVEVKDHAKALANTPENQDMVKRMKAAVEAQTAGIQEAHLVVRNGVSQELMNLCNQGAYKVRVFDWDGNLLNP